jgi:hypothetical protein
MARGVKARIRWFLANSPGRSGYCLGYCREALDVPATGVPSANAMIDVAREAGELHQGHPPVGALVLWHSSTYGHAALMGAGERS